MENTRIFDILSRSRTEDYFRYVDDLFEILVIYNENYTDKEEFRNSFNNITPRLNFTLELEKDNKFNFLDLTITRTDKNLSFDIYRKHISTDTTSDILQQQQAEIQ